MTAGIVAEVGRFYMVPCMFVKKGHRVSWVPRDGWVPILGPKHRDAEHLNFEYEHFHIDWRFMPERCLQLARLTMNGWSSVGRECAKVLTSTHGRHLIEGEPRLQRRLCRRHAVDFPAAPGGPNKIKWERLERAQAFVCSKLKPGNICPHRGIDLTPYAKPDGTAICPGHGLRWDLRTGELLPRYGAAA